MLKNLLLFGLTALLCEIGVSESCLAQDLTYRTRYTTASGQSMRATLAINGRSGTYRAYDRFGQYAGSGTVSDLQLSSLGGQMVLFGKWRWNAGGEGMLTFYMSENLRSFRGNWQYRGGGGGGRWQGSYSSGGGQLGENGPFVGS